MCSERGMLVWSTSMLRDEDMDKYVHTAFDKYKYNREQALALLFWHKHNMDRAMQDLTNFTPAPSEWSTNDKILFEQALKVLYGCVSDLQPCFYYFIRSRARNSSLFSKCCRRKPSGLLFSIIIGDYN